MLAATLAPSWHHTCTRVVGLCVAHDRWSRMLHVRVGVLVPSTNSSFEGDWQAVAAQLNRAASMEREAETCDFKMTVHGARLYLENDEMFTDPEGSMVRMNDQIVEQARALSTANVDIVAYGCTTGSFFKGPGWDEEMQALITENAGGVPSVGTSPAVVAALWHLGAKRLAIVTPYPDWNNERLERYMLATGFEVETLSGNTEGLADKYLGNQGVNNQLPQHVARFAIEQVGRLQDQQVDAVFCSCTAWRSMEAVQAIEAACNLPVVTSNQATIWASLRELGLTRSPVVGFGRLLNEHLA